MGGTIFLITSRQIQEVDPMYTYIIAFEFPHCHDKKIHGHLNLLGAELYEHCILKLVGVNYYMYVP